MLFMHRSRGEDTLYRTIFQLQPTTHSHHVAEQENYFHVAGDDTQGWRCDSMTTNLTAVARAR